ncbi:hypothetical protein GPECTOR_15g523 [Gonium pectorale]|uniref:Protein kinase domain-containing protein n=1 Tax=Gonium pectorale TaxID=33097 RepID=A0A150GM12_GONPE|nr:hypothetical protein GPECTOR_15g523 [Gonium pectorale]|eukprot:KXZ50837.1 hypothetical protein GPECTOR_15g523 [Gonium pectorale]
MPPSEQAVKEIFPSAPTFAKLTGILSSQQQPSLPGLSLGIRTDSASVSATPTKVSTTTDEQRFLPATQSTVASAYPLGSCTQGATQGFGAVQPGFGAAQAAGSEACSWDADVAAIIKEVRALAQLSQHPNIVRFVGLCLEPPLIVTEYYPRGNLHELLLKAAVGDPLATTALSWHSRLSMLHDIAAGMSYLHSQNYLHGDLRSPNVFVEQDSRVKIGDFGFARLLGDGGRGSASTGKDPNPRWMAPEALQFGRLTLSCDVYSFGVLMWEMLTWQTPYEEYEPAKVVLLLALDPEFRPVVPPRAQLPHVPATADQDGYVALMRRCWHSDPGARAPAAAPGHKHQSCQLFAGG